MDFRDVDFEWGLMEKRSVPKDGEGHITHHKFYFRSGAHILTPPLNWFLS